MRRDRRGVQCHVSVTDRRTVVVEASRLWQSELRDHPRNGPMPQSQPANPPIPDTVLSSKDALLEEYAAIIRNDWVDGKSPPRTTQWLHENEAELCAAPKTALCLSGGGIRSAAFCLGA